MAHSLFGLTCLCCCLADATIFMKFHTIITAVEAFESGAHVTLLEKQPRLGGNSAKVSTLE